MYGQDVIFLDDTHFPIVIVKTKIERLEEEEVRLYLQTMTDFYAENKGKNVVVVYDLSLLNAIDARGRIQVGEWLKEKSELIGAAVAGVCYVQKNILQKVILSGIFAVKNPEWQHKVVLSVEEGIEWGKSIIQNKKSEL